MLIELFNVLAAVLLLAGMWRYAKTILKFRAAPFGTPGKVDPPKVTWLIWVSLDTITFAGMLIKGTLTGQIIAAMAAWYLVYLGFRYGKDEYTPVDICCAVGAGVAVFLWQLYGDANWGIVTSCSVIFCGSFPAFQKAWMHPEKEDGPAWLIFLASCLVQMIPVILIGDWKIQAVIQPIVFLLIEILMVTFIYVRPYLVRQFA